LAYEVLKAYIAGKSEKLAGSRESGSHSSSKSPPYVPPPESEKEQTSQTSEVGHDSFEPLPKENFSQSPKREHSNIINFLSSRLVNDKEFGSIKTIPDPDKFLQKEGLDFILQKEGLDFVGITKQWASIASIGLVKADGISEQEINGLCETFYSFTKSLKKFAPRMKMYAGGLVGLMLSQKFGTKLSSIGLLCFVFEKGCKESLISFIQNQKFIRAWSNIYAVSWVLDAQNVKVHKHHGLPWAGMYPGEKYLEGLLYKYKFGEGK